MHRVIAIAIVLAASPGGAGRARGDILGQQGAPQAAREVRVVMGTAAEIRVTGAASGEAVLEAAFAALDRVDAGMSLWRPSELTRLDDRGRAVVSADLMAVLGHALDVAAASSGAFDPTVEPLVRASGLLGGTPHALPEAERRRLLSRVGFRRVHANPDTREVWLERGTRLDLGAIAKGYAADLALSALREAGAATALVDLGGSSIGVLGMTLGVEVRDPEAAGAPPWASFRVRDEAVSSSGGDQKPRHIFDPRTGRPATGVLATTVVASTGVEADALSTAVYVLGAEEGVRLLLRRGVAGIVLLRQAGKRVIVTTPGFAGRYGLVTAPGVELRE